MCVCVCEYVCVCVCEYEKLGAPKNDINTHTHTCFPVWGGGEPIIVREKKH